MSAPTAIDTLRAFRSMAADLTDVGRSTAGGYYRHAFASSELELRAWFEQEASRRGMPVESDRNGNLWAWWGQPGPGTVVTGSHLDSVPGGGPYDGPLGVMSAFLAIDALRARGVQPAKPLAVVAFVEEEGGRFGVPCAGSKLMIGATDPNWARAQRDLDGNSFAEAMSGAGLDARFIGPDPDRVAMLGAMVELHIEQGTLLRDVPGHDHGATVGVATATSAHGRWRVRLDGRGDHAGTTRIGDRRDPMIVAAETVLSVRRAMAGSDGAAVATVGRLTPTPGGTNVIPSVVELFIDGRSLDTSVLESMVAALEREVRGHGEVGGVAVEFVQEALSGAVHFDDGLRERLSTLLDVPAVPTFAGHDAGVLSAVIPTGMLFVRNPTGVSHSPEEYAEDDDCVAGVHALTGALEDLVS